jgi:hypothetical protein
MFDAHIQLKRPEAWENHASLAPTAVPLEDAVEALVIVTAAEAPTDREPEAERVAESDALGEPEGEPVTLCSARGSMAPRARSRKSSKGGKP